jgi:hypothetical protein
LQVSPKFYKKSTKIKSLSPFFASTQGIFFPNFNHEFLFYVSTLKFVIMKTLMYCFVMALIVMAGCSKDDTMFESQDNLELKKAKVPIPFKADCQAVYHLEIPGRLMLSGNATHLGKFNAEESFYQFTSVVPTEIDGQQFLALKGFGKIVGANGHGMEFTFWSYQSMEYIFKGKVEIISGTGKFAGCKGTLESSGGYDVAGDFAFMTITGSLDFE